MTTSWLISIILLGTAGADAAALAPTADHSGNTLFAQVTAEGAPMRLPAPTMPDGLTADQVQAIIAAIPCRHVSTDLLLQRSAVAPILFQSQQLKRKTPGPPLHAVDVWYVAYGKSLDWLVAQRARQDFQASAPEDVAAAVLTEDQLAARGIAPTDPGRQQWVHFEFPVMERVRLAVTNELRVSRTADSLLAVAVVDPRFRDDKDLPNTWRSLERQIGGPPKPGPIHPYGGGAAYWKVTRLPGTDDGLFIEFHLVFEEPEGWFDGRSILRSKLPVVMQNEVRRFRRELLK